jgi:hypothetical protein
MGLHLFFCKKEFAADCEQRTSSSLILLFRIQQCMKERSDPERTSQFNRLFLITISLTAFLALVIVGLLYGCATSSRPERQSPPPPPSGMLIFNSVPSGFGLAK